MSSIDYLTSQEGGYTITERDAAIIKVIAEPVQDTHFNAPPLPPLKNIQSFLKNPEGKVYLPPKLADIFGKYVVLEVLPTNLRFAAQVESSQDWLAEYGLALNFQTYEQIPENDQGEKKKILLKKLNDLKLPVVAPMLPPPQPKNNL